MKKNRLGRKFFKRPTLTVAKGLLGKYLATNIGGKLTAGKIVETEAYVGENDLACHASKGRTPRSETLYKSAGTIYVYMIYGMYYCLNIVTEKRDFPSAVLIRAIKPIDGVELIKKRRKINNLHNLASGPGKLCMALGINKNMNNETIFGKNIWLEDRGERVSAKEIESSPRIGVDYAKHCKKLLWRFYIKDNQFVSRK